MRSSATGLAFLALAAVLPTTACKARPSAAQAALAAADAAAAPANSSGQAKPSAPAQGPMLAYAYSYLIEAPADAIGAVSSRQEQACASAGPAVCQVLGSDVSTQDGEVSGSLKLRATPAWIAGFRGRLDADLKGAGGKVASAGVETEDLARSIVDTGAELRAKTLLRDRLEKLLAERPGKLEELLQLEKSIAEVQGEIDATQSELAAMQGRVQMSDLTLTYRSRAAVLGAHSVAPLGRALHGFASHALEASALLLNAASYLLPPALVAAIGWAIARRIRRRRRLPQA